MREGTCEDPFGVIVGKNTFFHVVSQLEGLSFEGDTDLGEAVTACQNPGGNDGLSVIISDFFTDSDWKKAVDYLVYKKRQLLLIQVLSPEEVEPLYMGRVHLLDAEAGDLGDPRNLKVRITRGLQETYDEALQGLIGEIRTYCAKRGAAFLTVRTDLPLEKTFFKELLKVGMME